MPLPAFETPLIFDGGQDGRANRYLPRGAGARDVAAARAAARRTCRCPTTPSSTSCGTSRGSRKRRSASTRAFYPLGSCTMKYNPRINDALANLPALRDLHPFAPDELAQGALAVMWELERSLASLFGMAAFSLNPAAGAHAELTALLIAKAYFKKRGETARTTVIVPDTAHGTNPASAAMVGYNVRLAQVRRARARLGRRDSRRGGSGHRRLHDDQPQHARAVRGSHPRDRGGRARGRRPDVLRRRQRQRADGQQPPRRHGLRLDAPQPAQDVLDSARRRRRGRGPGRRGGAPRSVSAGAGRARRGSRARATAAGPRTA